MEVIRIASLFILLGVVFSSPISRVDPVQYRLENDVVPKSYKLDLTLGDFRETDSYTGVVEITVQGKVNPSFSKKIELHSSGLKIDNVEMCKHVLLTCRKVAVAHTENKDVEKLILTLQNDEIENDEYKITIQFSGNLRSDMRSFYKGSYKEKDVTKYYLATQFESTDARKAFPCFDEPSLKADFTITVQLPDKLSNYKVLTNTEKITDVPETTTVATTTQSGGDQKADGLTTYKFEKTPVPISTYLVAIVVADFDSSDSETFVSNYGGEDLEKMFTTWARDGFENSVNFTQAIGPQIIDFMGKTLKIGYAYSKLDQVALPDFSPGAMENWGLLTFRESALLVNTENSTLKMKQSTLKTVAHELVHQWFGDLVTLEWWSDVWLNEGFANYFAYRSASEVRGNEVDTSSWDLMSQFVVDEIHKKAFVTDANEDSKPLHDCAVNSPEQIDSSFGNIAYAKGGSILRMLSHVLTDEIFLEGLREYIQEYKGGSVTSTSLVKSLVLAYDNYFGDKPPVPKNQDLKDVIDTWIEQSGYPVVSVSKGTGDNSKKYTLSQERFIMTQNIAGATTTEQPTTTDSSTTTTTDPPTTTTTDPPTTTTTDPPTTTTTDPPTTTTTDPPTTTTTDPPTTTTTDPPTTTTTDPPTTTTTDPPTTTTTEPSTTPTKDPPPATDELKPNSAEESMANIEPKIGTPTCMMGKASEDGEGNQNLWYIPITYTEKSFVSTKTQYWITPTENVTIELEGSSWYIINVQQTGYYRINYDLDNWVNLKKALEEDTTVLPAVHKAQLLSDLFAFAKTVNVDRNYTVCLDLTKYLKEEREYLPWATALYEFEYLRDIIAFNNDTMYEQKFQRYMEKILEDIFWDLSLEDNDDDEHGTKLLRPLIADWACASNHQRCIDRAESKFKDAKNKKIDKVAIDVRSSVYCSGIREGNEDDFKLLWDEYKLANDANQKNLIIGALGCSQNGTLIKTILKETVKAEAKENETPSVPVIREQDIVSTYSAIYNGNPKNADIVLSFFNDTKNLDSFINVGEHREGTLASIISGIASKLSTDIHIAAINNIKDWAEAENKAEVLSATESALNRINMNAKFWETNREEFVLWFEINGASETVAFSILGLFLTSFFIIFL